MIFIIHAGCHSAMITSQYGRLPQRYFIRVHRLYSYKQCRVSENGSRLGPDGYGTDWGRLCAAVGGECSERYTRSDIIYNANSVSSGRSDFFRLAAGAGMEGSVLGGDGRSGNLSTALARSSRNLSNSRRNKMEKGTLVQMNKS